MWIINFCLYLSLLVSFTCRCFAAASDTTEECSATSISKVGNFVYKTPPAASYKHGEFIKFSCQTGYVGFAKIICEHGRWVKEVDCQPRKCGHPGDATNGNFKLKQGTDFVFGAVVEYTCTNGYTMANRINYRTCTSQGWDNAIPTCEVVRCKAITPDDGMFIIGNPEEAQYGDVLQFQCESNTQKITGPKQIHCTQEGEWSDIPPKCERISCEFPNIPHIQRAVKKVYDKDEILRYSCEDGFTPYSSGQIRCTANGWSSMPVCEEFRCSRPQAWGVDSTSFTKFTYDVEEKVKYSCIEKYKKKQEFVTCTANDWSPPSNQLCTEITCPPSPEPGIVTIEGYGYELNFKMGLYQYKCQPGYTPLKSHVKCTENGWETQQLCRPNVPQKNCPMLTVQNGFISPEKTSYSSGDEIYYSCLPKYKPNREGWWGFTKCNEGKWDPIPKCIDHFDCAVPIISNGKLMVEADYYTTNKYIVQCNRGYTTENDLARCNNGTWNIASCKVSETACSRPPPVENANIVNPTADEYYSDGDKVTYQCTELYTMKDSGEMTCTKGTWSTPPQCIPWGCTSPAAEVNNAVLKEKGSTTFINTTQLIYECKDGFASQEQPKAVCLDGSWIYPHCTKKDYCDKPEMRNGNVLNPKERYREDEELHYTCIHPYTPYPDGKSTCIDAKWTPKPTCKAETCEEPDLDHGAVIDSTRRGDGLEVTFQCKRRYKLKGPQKVLCRNGVWPELPVCLPPCEVSRIDAKYNLQSSRETEWVEEGNTYEFKCKPGLFLGCKFFSVAGWSKSQKVTCINGSFQYPQCYKC